MESTIDRYRLAVEVEFHQDGTKEVEKELAEHGTLQDTFQYSASELGLFCSLSPPVERAARALIECDIDSWARQHKQMSRNACIATLYTYSSR